MKHLLAVLVILTASVVAFGQERPLSVPDRAPVPMTDKDQARAAADNNAKAADNNAKKDTAPSPVKEKTEAATLVASPVKHISTGNAAYDQIVYEAAAEHGIDPCLIISIMRAESSFSLTARSIKGALGLMQLMPATAARFGVKDIFNARENIFGGTKYLKWLLDRYQGDVRLALAGYNAGEGAVETYGNRIPPYGETQFYVRLIYSRYSSIHSAPQSQTLTGDTQKPVEKTAAEPNGKAPTFNQIIRFAPEKRDQ